MRELSITCASARGLSCACAGSSVQVVCAPPGRGWHTHPHPLRLPHPVRRPEAPPDDLPRGAHCHEPRPRGHRELKALEGQLLRLNTEKDLLTAEFDKMPAHAGRTLSVRTRKAAVEARLGAIEREISAVRLHLKTTGYR